MNNQVSELIDDSKYESGKLAEYGMSKFCSMSDADTLQAGMDFLGWKGGTVWQVVVELQKKFKHSVSSVNVHYDIRYMLFSIDRIK